MKKFMFLIMIFLISISGCELVDEQLDTVEISIIHPQNYDVDSYSSEGVINIMLVMEDENFILEKEESLIIVSKIDLKKIEIGIVKLTDK